MVDFFFPFLPAGGLFRQAVLPTTSGKIVLQDRATHDDEIEE